MRREANKLLLETVKNKISVERRSSGKAIGQPEHEILENSILKALLYYDIFSHPLKSDEVFAFLPRNSVTKDEVSGCLERSALNGSAYGEKDGYYYIKPNSANVAGRLEKESQAKRMWKITHFMTHVIKRFPFVRCVLVTGSLSKNSSDNTSDIDFMVITAPNRLWVARTMLMLFKKIFLLNSKKYFCINYLITENNLVINERNIFTATEIATIKPVYNLKLAEEFVSANPWVKEFFPNYVVNDCSQHTPGCKITNRRSILQRISEIFFTGSIGDKLDEYFRGKTIKHWKNRFPELNENERNVRLKSTREVSKAHPGSVMKKILEMYNQKLTEHNL